MIFPDFSVYKQNFLISQRGAPKDSPSSNTNYAVRLADLLEVIESVAKTIEYGDNKKIPRLINSDLLIVYDNIKPYFQPPDSLVQRITYNDVLILAKNKKSNFNSLPKDVIYHILKLKNELPFMSFLKFKKFV